MTTDKDRLVWPDAAKGFCIFLVVLVHLTWKSFVELDWPKPGALGVTWQGLSAVLTPIRMPLFFAISGYFAGRYIGRAWREVLRPRIIAPYYLYVVWFILHTLIFLTPLTLAASRPDGLGGFFLGLVFGYTSLWYLYALPVYFVLVKCLAKWPRTTLVVAALVSVVASTELLPSIGNSSSVVGSFVFFAAAAYLPHWFQGIAERATGGRSLLFLIAFGFSSTAMVVVAYLQSEPSALMDVVLGILEIGVSVVAIYSGVSAFSWLCSNAPRVSRPWAAIGRRTLSVYVLHLPIMAVMNLFLAQVQPPVVLVAVYPLLGSAVLLAACIGLHRLLIVIGVGWLFALPPGLFPAVVTANAEVGSGAVGPRRPTVVGRGLGSKSGSDADKE